MSAVIAHPTPTTLDPFTEHFRWRDPKTGHALTLRHVVLERDLPTLHRWMNEPHVAPNWMLDKPIDALRDHFTQALADTHHRLYMLLLDEREIGYIEIYHAATDRLGEYYHAHPHDWGIHMLIGEKDVIGQGCSESIIRCVMHYIFTCTPATKVVGEPNHEVKAYLVLAERIGYEPQGLIDFPEKTAVLLFGYRDRFYEKNAV